MSVPYLLLCAGAWLALCVVTYLVLSIAIGVGRMVWRIGRDDED